MSGNPDLLGGRIPNLDHQSLIDGDLEVADYVVRFKDRVDRESGFGKYKGRAEGPVARAKEFQTRRPSLLRRLGTALIEGYNSFRSPEE